ncbi:MAG: hypothetical protein HYV09_20705 [Deltaproteobacteria bacterium]|nr:hypothetical protein [Deltaproteobacteria bacterium]
MRKTAKQLGLPVANDVGAAPAKAFCHRNRHGVAYYLHRGTTRTGKPRYFFAKTIGESPLTELPAGWEVAESVNGVVTVRKADPAKAIPPADLSLVRDALDRDPVGRQCVVEAKGGAIIIHEPEGGSVPIRGDLAQLSKTLGLLPSEATAYFEAMSRNARYTPVMKFEPAFVGRAGEYLAHRRSYRGDGGWLALSHGSLDSLVKKYVRHIARESFFELM